MQVFQTALFLKSIKKLHKKQKKHIDQAIWKIINNPTLGEIKKGDLCNVRVYKFKMLNQIILLAYKYRDKRIVFLALGTHENFYRDLKKSGPS